MPSKEEQKIMGLVIFGLIALYFAVKISKELFPFFLFLTAISLIASIIISFIDTEDLYKLISWGSCGVFLILTIITYSIGFGIEKTETGKDLVKAGEELHDALKTVEEAEQAIKDARNEVTGALIEEAPEDIRPTLNQSLQIIKIAEELK